VLAPFICLFLFSSTIPVVFSDIVVFCFGGFFASDYIDKQPLKLKGIGTDGNSGTKKKNQKKTNKKKIFFWSAITQHAL
jgi:hypothetical protein